ncbi:hypothetical protein RHOER0001_5515 [Rhodococcus erythropolis SK121]|nr:hypothetical protein RHOER0001_5515 [Rhodococcus erythropolis SK121]
MVLCGVPDPDETRGEVPNGFVVVLVPLADCLVEVVSETVAALAVPVFWVSKNARVEVPITTATPIPATAAVAIRVLRKPDSGVVMRGLSDIGPRGRGPRDPECASLLGRRCACAATRVRTFLDDRSRTLCVLRRSTSRWTWLHSAHRVLKER